MKKINKECCLCHKKYHYCSSCGVSEPTWKMSFCCEEHKKIYEIVAGVYAGQIEKQDAKTLLDTCDLFEKEKFTEATKKMINEIYSVEKKESVKQEYNAPLHKNKEFQFKQNAVGATINKNKKKKR